jgi:NAD(P) transhydrogenase
MSQHYDLIVIGSGPAGEKAAVKAAYYGKRVALIERESMYGGAGTNTGTMPSKTLKETALYLSGKRDMGPWGIERKLERNVSIEDFFFRKKHVVNELSGDVHTNLLHHMVDLYRGNGRFVDAHTIEVVGEKPEKITGDFIIIATGSYPFHPEGIPFETKSIHDSDTILDLDSIPKTMVVVGAGVIGCEYATIFAAMGVKVTVVNSRPEILPWLDKEVADALIQIMKEDGVDFIFNTRLQNVTVEDNGNGKVSGTLTSGEILSADVFLYAAGRCGNVKGLNLEAVGISVDNRENIVVDNTYKTSVPNIYAVGDVIGFPSLASTSMDQGRVAVTHIFHLHDLEHIAKDFPYGVYTIPEVSTFGMNEEKAKELGIDYVIGKALYSQTPRGLIFGAKRGFLKLVVEKSSHRILGVHIIGPIATELIHYGMDVIEGGRTIGHVVSNIFNCPTLHELYKYAAYSVYKNLGIVKTG